jgi:hypothetical protein
MTKMIFFISLCVIMVILIAAVLENAVEAICHGIARTVFVILQQPSVLTRRVRLISAPASKAFSDLPDPYRRRYLSGDFSSEAFFPAYLNKQPPCPCVKVSPRQRD